MNTIEWLSWAEHGVAIILLVYSFIVTRRNSALKKRLQSLQQQQQQQQQQVPVTVNNYFQDFRGVPAPEVKQMPDRKEDSNGGETA